MAAVYTLLSKHIVPQRPVLAGGEEAAPQSQIIIVVFLFCFFHLFCPFLRFPSQTRSARSEEEEAEEEEVGEDKEEEEEDKRRLILSLLAADCGF